MNDYVIRTYSRAGGRWAIRGEPVRFNATGADALLRLVLTRKSLPDGCIATLIHADGGAVMKEGETAR